MAEVYEATEMMDVTQAHIDGCGLMSTASLEFAEILASQGGKVSIPTTLNMVPLDLQNWREFGIPKILRLKPPDWLRLIRIWAVSQPGLARPIKAI